MTDHRAIDIWKDVSSKDWGDWHWQLRNSIHDTNELNRIVSYFTERRVELNAEIEKQIANLFPFSVTPHVILALSQALRHNRQEVWGAFCGQYIPNRAELERQAQHTNGRDGIGEELPTARPTSLITKFYRNRVLFRLTSMCPAYCRFCFRRRNVGNDEVWDEPAVEAGIRYIASDSAINEVILSGGDPLTLSTKKIESLLERICSISHVLRVRFDTRVLSVVPQRVTTDLIKIFRRFSPIFIVGHFCHPYELTSETRSACEALADAGVSLASHTPLLKGINDQAPLLSELFEMLVNWRVRPYYLIQFIPTRWSEHFRVPIAESLKIVRELDQRCSGLATPSFIVYLPDAGGKVPVLPPYLKGRDKDGWVFENLEGRVITYPEPQEYYPNAKE